MIKLSKKLKQIRENLFEAGCKFKKLQDKKNNKLSKEEKIKELKSKGWKEKQEWWSHPDLNCQIVLDNAFDIQTRWNSKEKIKEDIKNYTAKIFCNKCGENCQKFHEKEFSLGYYGLINAELSGGYMSEYLLDGERYRFSLCEKCVLELFSTFKKSPEVEVYF